MKKQLLMGALLLAGAFSSTAQIADGSAAPDFTATDQFGVSHTLSDYLAAGKTVIIDISATWCGPCWGYHNTHALADLYNAFGPNGSDEIMVFFIEGDGATSTADLEGTTAGTQGDWLTGTPYPIIDDASIATAYQIGFFPTIYRICPDGQGGGTVYEEGQSPTATFITSLNTNCSSNLQGVSDHAGLSNSEIGLCDTDGAPSFDFHNYGSNDVTSASIDLLENGSVVATAPFSGTVAQFAAGTVTFPSMTINAGSTYTAEITDVNNGSPFNNNLTTSDMAVYTANNTGYSISVDFFTDNYPSETSWEIISSGGAVVASGGPYTPGTDDPDGAGGPDAQTTMSSTHTLPNGVDCYSVKFTDTYGDGQQFGTGTNPQGGFGIEVKSFGNVILNYDGGSGWADITRDAAMKTDATSGLGEIAVENISIFPNPASDVLNVMFNAESLEYTVAILDLQGRVLASESGSQNVTFQVGDFAAGSYLVTITTDLGVHTENVVIK